MKFLTGLDATFLYLETPEIPMHVGSPNLCELPAGFKGSFHQGGAPAQPQVVQRRSKHP